MLLHQDQVGPGAEEVLGRRPPRRAVACLDDQLVSACPIVIPFGVITIPSIAGARQLCPPKALLRGRRVLELEMPLTLLRASVRPRIRRFANSHWRAPSTARRITSADPRLAAMMMQVPIDSSALPRGGSTTALPQSTRRRKAQTYATCALGVALGTSVASSRSWGICHRAPIDDRNISTCLGSLAPPSSSSVPSASYPPARRDSCSPRAFPAPSGSGAHGAGNHHHSAAGKIPHSALAPIHRSRRVVSPVGPRGVAVSALTPLPL